MDWVRGETLGRGSFGTVNLAIPRVKTSASSGTSTPQLMAVKSCCASNFASLINEKSILDEFRDCPEIIQCYGDSYSYDNGEKLYNVFLEYASGGSLSDKLKNSSDRGLPEIQISNYTKGILRGLNRIHKKGFVHCDMKLQNILLSQDGAVKIADFGLAKRIGQASIGFELRGTPLYMSPEMVAGGNQGTPADIWAVGCLVAEMATGAPVWRSTDMAALLMKIGIGDEVPEIPANFSAEGKDFLGKCFIKDPTRRWTAKMLLDHPFLASCQDEDDDIPPPLKDAQVEGPSTSPRSAFDFPDWTSQQSSSLTFSITSTAESSSWFPGGSGSKFGAERVRELVSDQQPDWSVSDDWVTIR
ncbi:hypothetical protein M9H77_05764 [Catharanthus roseus]|uniref:Uncharacterized protein n=1 Tax=Catharanthus roseus TaxID=4058 RepID=A0ACC0CIC3_CATRO|nr:hypothetical protein M9H77_05764 [Catharanthus roseus]